MKNYKAEVTLNEKDSLFDMLLTEKTLVKLYATALTEGCSKGYRKSVQKYIDEVAFVEAQIFFMLTERDYARVHSAEKSAIDELKKKFSEVKHQLS